MESQIQAHRTSGEWSPRISFSYGFATKQRISSPPSIPIQDSDFEFSSFIGPDLTPRSCMLSADELFSDGKLRLGEGGSEFGMTGIAWRRDVISVCRGNVGEICSGGETQNINVVGRELPMVRLLNGAGIAEEVAGNASVNRGSGSRNQADAARSFSNRRDLLSVARDRTREKERLPTTGERLNPADKLQSSDNTGECKLPTSRADVISLQKRKNAGEIQSPTSRVEAVSPQKLQMGAKGSKLRLLTSREDPLPACKQDTGSRAGKLRSPPSRDGLMEVTKRKATAPINKECLKSAVTISGNCEETRIPVRWRGEASSSKKNKDDEHASHLKRFSRNPRSASMTMGGFSQFANRTCVSLDNSRCPSPSRSFSLPATSPSSPTASRSFSVFSSSSSNSGYRSRIKDFFRLKKPAPKEGESSAPSCRLPTTRGSFLPFFKHKEGRTNSSDSTHEQRITATSEGEVSSNHKGLDYTSKTTAHVAKPPPESNSSRNLGSSAACRADASMTSSMVDKSVPNAAIPGVGSRNRIRQFYSLPHEKLVLGKDGQIVLGIDETIWKEASIGVKSDKVRTESPAKQGNHKNTRVNMVNSGGGLARHHSKGMERPISYTSSVRVTPVLNVPSCITPSLRKAKPSSKSKTFSFERIFPRGKAPVDDTT